MFEHTETLVSLPHTLAFDQRQFLDPFKKSAYSKYISHATLKSMVHDWWRRFSGFGKSSFLADFYEGWAETRTGLIFRFPCEKKKAWQSELALVIKYFCLILYSSSEPCRRHVTVIPVFNKISYTNCDRHSFYFFLHKSESSALTLAGALISFINPHFS